MAGKGDRYRPVNQAKYGANYDKIFRPLKIFKEREIREALTYTMQGGQALHLFSNPGLYPKAPAVFKRYTEAAHLFDQNKDRLIATARKLGVRVIKVSHEGTDRQHIDLCGNPLLVAKLMTGLAS